GEDADSFHVVGGLGKDSAEQNFGIGKSPGLGKAKAFGPLTGNARGSPEAERQDCGTQAEGGEHAQDQVRPSPFTPHGGTGRGLHVLGSSHGTHHALRWFRRECSKKQERLPRRVPSGPLISVRNPNPKEPGEKSTRGPIPYFLKFGSMTSSV